MMKRNNSILNLLLLLTISLFISCSDSSGNNDNVIKEIETNKLLFSFPKEGGEEMLYVQAASALSVASSDITWCEVTAEPTESKKTKKYKISVRQNDNTESRNTIIIISDNKNTKNIGISQEGSTYFNIEKKDFNVAADGEIISVKVESSSEVKITVNAPSWIKLSETKTVNESTFNFSIEKNQMSYSRTGSITIENETDKDRITITQEANTSIPDPDKSGMESDAKDLAKKIFMGWNLGNTMEVPGSEIAWGNPKTTKEMIDVVKNAGYNAVRIPCAWNSYLEDKETFKIKESWLARVKEVITYCTDNDMYVVLNIHWDGGWLEENLIPDNQENLIVKQKALWTQIASYLRDFDEHLLFAGCNEPNVDNASQMQVLKACEQAFIDAVRATGGRNHYRNLIIQGPYTDIDKTLNLMDLATDEVPNRMMVEVHYYTPWQFCLMEEDQTNFKVHYFWGKDFAQYAKDEYAGRWSDDFGEKYVDSKFQEVKSMFVDKGIPVIVGEFGAMKREMPDSKTQKYHDEIGRAHV